MLDTTNIDRDEVFAAENRLAEILKENGLDAAPGTALRELVVRPTAVMNSLEESWRGELVSSLNLYAIADGTVEGDDGLVDAIASIYRIQRKGGSASNGIVAIDINYNGQPVYVNQSWFFSIGDEELAFNGVWAGSIDGTTGDGLVNKQRFIRYPSGTSDDGTVEYSYIMMIPVSCESGSEFAAGTPVTVSSPTEGLVKTATVFSPITGGGGTESNQSLASRILEALPPGVMSTPLQIKNTLFNQFGIPVHRTAVIGGQEGLARAKDALTGIPLPGFVDVYTAATGDCPMETVTTGLEHLESGPWRAVIEPPVSSGVYDISEVVVDGTPITSGSYSVSWETLPDSRHIIPEGTGEYSSFQRIIVDINVTWTPSSESAQLTLRRQLAIQSIQEFADSAETRAPGQDLVVKAAVPFFLSMTVAVERSDVEIDTIIDAICSHVNNLPVGRGYLSGQDIVDAVDGIGVKIAFPVTMSAVTTSGSSVSSANGRLDVDMIAPGRGVFYLSTNNVQVVVNES